MTEVKKSVTVIALLVTAVALGLWALVFSGYGQNHMRSVDNAVALSRGGDPDKGYVTILSAGCGGCHEIKGIPAAHGKIGPSLEHFKERAMIAGVMANSTDNLIRWIQHPRSIDPQTAMPDLGLTEDEARNISSYLLK